jgi:hypothetical protein
MPFSVRNPYDSFAQQPGAVKLLRAIFLGSLMALLLAHLVTKSFRLPPAQSGRATTSLTDRRLVSMRNGTASLPYVRRILVPILLRSTEAALPTRVKALLANPANLPRLQQNLVWAKDDPLDCLVCTLIWSVFFALFLFAFEGECAFYASSTQQPLLPLALTLATCLLILAMLRDFCYIYDPPTLAFAVLALRSIRKQDPRLLILITALFALNRETAAIVPGMVFLYWIYRHQPRRAFSQAAILGTIYLIITALIVYHFRNNPGEFAENNRAILMHLYLGPRRRFALTICLLLVAYAIAVTGNWQRLPAALKAVQPFVPLWIAMHLLWGWPMELRVLFEVLPGMALTVIFLATRLRFNA